MSFNLHQLDLLDLISERYLKLRKISEAQWNSHHELPISKSEWFILLRIYQEKETTVSFISKSVRYYPAKQPISSQAASRKRTC